MSFGHASSLSRSESLVGVVNLDVAKDAESVSVFARAEHLRVVNNENVSVAFAEGHASNASEGSHAHLRQSFSRFLHSTVHRVG